MTNSLTAFQTAYLYHIVDNLVSDASVPIWYSVNAWVNCWSDLLHQMQYPAYDNVSYQCRLCDDPRQCTWFVHMRRLLL